MAQYDYSDDSDDFEPEGYQGEEHHGDVRSQCSFQHLTTYTYSNHSNNNNNINHHNNNNNNKYNNNNHHKPIQPIIDPSDIQYSSSSDDDEPPQKNNHIQPPQNQQNQQYSNKYNNCNQPPNNNNNYHSNNNYDEYNHSKSMRSAPSPAPSIISEPPGSRKQRKPIKPSQNQPKFPPNHQYKYPSNANMNDNKENSNNHQHKNYQYKDEYKDEHKVNNAVNANNLDIGYDPEKFHKYLQSNHDHQNKHNSHNQHNQYHNPSINHQYHSKYDQNQRLRQNRNIPHNQPSNQYNPHQYNNNNNHPNHQHHNNNNHETKQTPKYHSKPPHQQYQHEQHQQQPQHQQYHPQPPPQQNHSRYDSNKRYNDDSYNNNGDRYYGSMKHRNINGFNCGPNYNPQHNVITKVRMPEENISWLTLDEVDLLDLIKKLILQKHKKKYNNINDNDEVNYFVAISYNELHQYLVYSFPSEYDNVATRLNHLLYNEEREGYIMRIGSIGKKECEFRIIIDRELNPKELGKVLSIGNGKYKAMTYDSRELDAECESIQEAKQRLLQQPQFDPDLNWRSKFFKAFRNFQATKQVFRSLEAELDCSVHSSLNDLYLLPFKVIDELNKEYKKINGINDQVTFGEFINFVDNDDEQILFSVKQLIGNDGIDMIYNKISDALWRAQAIQNVNSNYLHTVHTVHRGILKCKHPTSIILSRDKVEVEIMDIKEIKNICVGSVVEYKVSQNNNFKALNIIEIEGAMNGFSNYVDIIGQKQNYQYYQYHNNRNLDKWILRDIISNELELSRGTFDMHTLPRIVENTLKIEWDAKKFGFESLRAIFEDYDIKRICRLDNASSTALVSTIEKSKEIPTMDFIKNGFEKVLRKYGDHHRGYRMKKKGSKKTDIRAHFALLTGKALKPKAWFGINVKDLIRKCDDIIKIDYDTEPDGVWLLFLK